jgi:hypothetical protein
MANYADDGANYNKLLVYYREKYTEFSSRLDNNDRVFAAEVQKEIENINNISDTIKQSKPTNSYFSDQFEELQDSFENFLEFNMEALIHNNNNNLAEGGKKYNKRKTKKHISIKRKRSKKHTKKHNKRKTTKKRRRAH